MKWIAAFAALVAAPLALAAKGEFAPAPAVPEPDVTACQGCHGSDGVATLPGAPNLAGQKADYLAAQLRAFRAGSRKNELMNAIASQLDDGQIAALAAYWSRQPAGGSMDDAARRAGAVRSQVTFPAGFPEGFTVYRTEEDHEGKTILRDWANHAALDAVRAGKPLPETGVIVAETSSAHEVDGKLVADAPRTYAVFAAGPGWGASVPEVLRNGNWHFGIFGADRTPKLTNQAACLACHKPQASSSFMFTYDVLKASAQ